MQLAPYAHENYIEWMPPDQMSVYVQRLDAQKKITSLQKGERKTAKKKLNCNQEKEELLR